MPIKVFVGESRLSIDGLPVRTLVAATGQTRARALLERVSVHVSRHMFLTYWPVTESKHECSVAKEEGIWVQTRKRPREYQRLDWSAGRLYKEEDAGQC